MKLKGNCSNSIKLCFQSNPSQGNPKKSFCNNFAFCKDQFNTAAVWTLTLCSVLLLHLTSRDTSFPSPAVQPALSRWPCSVSSEFTLNNFGEIWLWLSQLLLFHWLLQPVLPELMVSLWSRHKWAALFLPRPKVLLEREGGNVSHISFHG